MPTSSECQEVQFAPLKQSNSRGASGGLDGTFAFPVDISGSPALGSVSTFCHCGKLLGIKQLKARRPYFTHFVSGLAPWSADSISVNPSKAEHVVGSRGGSTWQSNPPHR